MYSTNATNSRFQSYVAYWVVVYKWFTWMLFKQIHHCSLYVNQINWLSPIASNKRRLSCCPHRFCFTVYLCIFPFTFIKNARIQNNNTPYIRTSVWIDIFVLSHCDLKCNKNVQNFCICRPRENTFSGCFFIFISCNFNMHNDQKQFEMIVWVFSWMVHMLLTSIGFAKNSQNCSHLELHQRMTRSYSSNLIYRH